LLGPPLDLILEQAFEELHVAPVAVEGLSVARLKGGQDAREPQLLELGRELGVGGGGAQGVHGTHATPPSPPNRWPSNSAAVRTKVRAGAAPGLGGTDGGGSASSPWSRMRLRVA